METWFWILGWFLSILTMTGNGIIIFIVCRKRQLRTKTNAFVVSLAVADFCVGMISFPTRFFCEVFGECNWPIYFFRGLFVYASATNLCSLVLDRYMAVAKPLTYLTFMKRRRVIQMISLSWVIPVVFSVLVTSRVWFNLHTPVIDNIVGWLYTVFELLLCAIVIFCFASMVHVVCKHARSARILAKQLRFNHHALLKTQDTSAVKMMAIVVGLFLLCYGIALRCNFVYYLGNQTPCNDLRYKVPIQVLNSAVNPLAYAIFKRDIKKEFKRLLWKSN
ncbi:octopamine receptor beta-2R-like [Oculina patagonica]